MINRPPFEQIAEKLYAALPAQFKGFENEVNERFRDILQAAFSKMDFVTREEFDIQKKVLLRTREKVDALQKQLDALLEMKSK